jgi:flagellar FliJ protein
VIFVAKFVYRMQNILDIKYKLETQAKTVYAAASEELRREELKLKLLFDDINTYEDRIRELSSSVLDVQELKWCMKRLK